MGRSKRLRPRHLGKKLKQIRAILELSQVGMAEALDFPTVHPTNISGYERGLREPPYPVLLKYARLVGISTDILIDDKLEIHPNKKRS
ncbi:MAG TPA: helix-turn-helix transcriptional regulator [Candidatus Saccharimonadales bacterium]|nr:helix-turn-helix transcriptional regulator [Candidatus Saccharimonadales bacterium]